MATVGLDLAKNGFQVHGVDSAGKRGLKKQLRREQVVPFFANLPTCLIGMEACGGAHHWARRRQSLGQTVKLKPPQVVNPDVKTNKDDAAGAEANWYGVGRPTRG